MANYRKIRYEAPELHTFRVKLERGFSVSDPYPGGESEPFSLGVNSQEENY